MNIGLFGGTFDPVHLGHLIISELTLEELALDEVCFVPASQPPHKPEQVITPFIHRAAMLEMAVSGNPKLSVNRIEENLSVPSFTVQTLRLLAATYPQNRYYLMIGGDSFVHFSQWKDPEGILELSTPAVYPRKDWDSGTAAGPLREKSVILNLPLIDLSSSMIRERLKTGRSVKYMIPDCVAEYIQTHQLYR